MSSSQSKIFAIGLSKTGTTSLARALEIIGFKTRDYLGVSSYRAGDLSSVNLDEINANDAFTDTPIPSFYRELDVTYPGSKFILTVRDRDAWLKSCKKQFNQNHADKQSEANNRLFMDLYGCTVFDEEKFSRGYENFVNGVMQYFRDRPQDLLILDVAAEVGWEVLCAFLGKSVPNVPFPKANVTQIRWININDVVDVIKLAGKEILAAHEIIQANIALQEKQRTRQSGTRRSVLGKASYVLRGGAAGMQKAARKKAYKVITKRLRELNPRIPVISTEFNDVPYSQRSGWNHFWLVDTLDGDEGFMDPQAAFTLNIALIEDRKPNLGVVYAPTSDTVYYATGGNKAFKIDRWGHQIPIQAQIHPKRSISSDKSRIATGAENDKNPASMSTALAICQAAEGKSHVAQLLDETMEWETAGAHAVLHAAGMKLIGRSSKKELAYNKESFKNHPINIQ